jgi:hypothetical protein
VAWRGSDLNRRPLGYEPSDLTELIYRAMQKRRAYPFPGWLRRYSVSQSIPSLGHIQAICFRRAAIFSINSSTFFAG